jgi:hypothetical protein
MKKMTVVILALNKEQGIGHILKEGRMIMTSWDDGNNFDFKLALWGESQRKVYL